ncbi:MAG TPA: hypothetical protein PKY31_09170 [Spirochaetota bacterium]|nr:hypothetical protein [Spirochaetota bacterium]
MKRLYPEQGIFAARAFHFPRSSSSRACQRRTAAPKSERRVSCSSVRGFAGTTCARAHCLPFRM